MSLAGAAVSRAAVIPACITGALSGVYTNANGTDNGFTCEISDKIYSNFVYVTAGADPDAAQVNVAIDNNTSIAQTGLQLTSAVPGLVWLTPGFSLSYNVTVDQAACAAIYGAGHTCTITGAQGQFQGAFNSNAATLEDVFAPGGTIILDGAAPSDNTKNLNLGSQPLTSTNVTITGTAAGQTDPIDRFGLDLYQTAAPEPATVSLIGAGLLGLGLLQRRRAARK